jgi:citrate lyase alpha subunit
MDAVKGKGLPIRATEDIKAEVERICGGNPARPRLGERAVAVVKWVDGTVLDTVGRCWKTILMPLSQLAESRHYSSSLVRQLS